MLCFDDDDERIANVQEGKKNTERRMLEDMKVVTAREGGKKRKSLGLPLCKKPEHPTIPMQNFSFFTANANCRKNSPCARPTSLPQSWGSVAAVVVAGCATETGSRDVAAPSVCACCYTVVATAALPSRPGS